MPCLLGPNDPTAAVRQPGGGGRFFEGHFHDSTVVRCIASHRKAVSRAGHRASHLARAWGAELLGGCPLSWPGGAAGLLGEIAAEPPSSGGVASVTR